MASTYTNDLRLELQAAGENASTWGTKLNATIQQIEDAVAGLLAVSTTGGDTTLTTVSGGTDQSRYAILKITGTLVSNSNIIVPAVSKRYLIWNATSGAFTVTVKTSAGTGIAVTQGATASLFCDETNVLLEAAGASQAVELTNKTITSAVAKGTWTASGTWTLPAFTLGGAVTGGSQNISGLGTLGCGAITTSGNILLPLPSIGGSTAIEFPYYGDANAKTRIVATGTSDHRQTLCVQMNTAQSDSAPVDVLTISAGGILRVANTDTFNRHTIQAINDSSYVATLTHAGGTPYGLQVYYSNVSGGAGSDFIVCGDSNADRFKVTGNGDVQNVNNSYGAISDLKLKQDIVDAKSQWADIKALTVRKYRLKSDPTGPMMMGLVAQEAEAVSPGLIDQTDDYEEVVVEPARTEVKTSQRQKTQKVIVEQPTPTLVDGRYVLRMMPTEIDAPLFEAHPLYDDGGSPIMEIVEPAQPEQVDEYGAVVRPAKPAVTRQAAHRVPVMEDVEETVEIPAKTERRLTGTQTKSVKYSILYMKAVRALQEAMVRIETLEAEVAAIKGAV